MPDFLATFLLRSSACLRREDSALSRPAARDTVTNQDLEPAPGPALGMAELRRSGTSTRVPHLKGHRTAATLVIKRKNNTNVKVSSKTCSLIIAAQVWSFTTFFFFMAFRVCSRHCTWRGAGVGRCWSWAAKWGDTGRKSAGPPPHLPGLSDLGVSGDAMRPGFQGLGWSQVEGKPSCGM